MARTRDGDSSCYSDDFMERTVVCCTLYSAFPGELIGSVSN